jgi:hypothetical protein
MFLPRLNSFHLCVVFFYSACYSTLSVLKNLSTKNNFLFSLLSDLVRVTVGPDTGYCPKNAKPHGTTKLGFVWSIDI